MFRVLFIIVICIWLAVSTLGNNLSTSTNLYSVCSFGNIYELSEGESQKKEIILEDLRRVKDTANHILNTSSTIQLRYKEPHRIGGTYYEFVTNMGISTDIKHPMLVLVDTFNVDTFIQTVYHDFVHWHYIFSDVRRGERKNEESQDSLAHSYKDILKRHTDMLCHLHVVLANSGKTYNYTAYDHTDIGSLRTTERYIRDVTLLIKMQEYTQQVMKNVHMMIKIIQDMDRGPIGHGGGHDGTQWRHIDDSSPCSDSSISAMIASGDWLSPGHVRKTGIKDVLIEYAQKYHQLDRVVRPVWHDYFLQEFPFSFDGLPDMTKFEHIDRSMDNTGLYGVIYEDVLRLVYLLETVRMEEIVADGESMEPKFNKLILDRLLPFACLVKHKAEENHLSQWWLSHRRLSKLKWKSLFSELKCFPPPISKADILSNQIVNIRSPEARHWRDLVVLSHTYKYFHRLEHKRLFVE